MRTPSNLTLGFNMIALAALCLTLGADEPAYAHDCLQRIQNALHTVAIPTEVVEDCMRTGWFQAALTGITGTVVAGVIVRQIITVIMRATPSIHDTSIPWSERPEHWPKDLKGGNAFGDLGRAIQREVGFQALDNDIDRSRYIFERFRKAAAVYGFSAAAQGGDQVSVAASREDHWMPIGGGVLGGFAFVGISLWLGGLPAVAVTAKTLIGLGLSIAAGAGGGHLLANSLTDPENVGGLKRGPGTVGNCGEFSYAFQQVLGGADVQSKVVFADNDPTPGTFSGQNNPIPGQGYISTDTAVMVTERLPGAKKATSRIFDPFRQNLHEGFNDPDKPTLPGDWANLPPTKAEVTPGNGPQTSWLDNQLRNNSPPDHAKGYIKDQQLNVVFADPAAH